jgi:hypothetical protein
VLGIWFGNFFTSFQILPVATGNQIAGKAMIHAAEFSQPYYKIDCM